MKKTILMLTIILTVLMMVACTMDGMTIDEILIKSGLKTATPDYTGKGAWDEAGCAAPVVRYVGTGSTVYAESATAPTEKGTYLAIFTLEGQSVEAVEVPFEL